MSSSSKKSTKIGHATIIPDSNPESVVLSAKDINRSKGLYINKCFKQKLTFITSKSNKYVYNDLGRLNRIWCSSCKAVTRKMSSHTTDRSLRPRKYKLEFEEMDTGRIHNIVLFPDDSLIMVEDCNLLRTSIFGGRSQKRRRSKRHQRKTKKQRI